MKRYIFSSKNTSQSFIDSLKERGIDTTPSKYALHAEAYERYERGKRYTKRFSCEGDYLAYFSMLLHTKPSYKELLDYFDDEDDLQEFIEDYPTTQDIAEYASENWWGDGDDYIIYLKNLTTGEYLYQGEEYMHDEDE